MHLKEVGAVLQSMMYHPGDPVIFRMGKCTTHPGPRAKEVSPAPHGEYYRYVVDKFWVVARVLEDHNLVVRTRRGKEHLVRDSDPRLRRPSWWERLMYKDRFPRLDAQEEVA